MRSSAAPDLRTAGLWIALAGFVALELWARFNTVVGFNELSDINLFAGFGEALKNGKFFEYVPGMPMTPALGSLLYPPAAFALHAAALRWVDNSLASITALYAGMNVLKLFLVFKISRRFLSLRMSLLCTLFCAPFGFRHMSYGTDVLAVLFYLGALLVLLRGDADEPFTARRAAAAGALLGLMFSFKQNLTLGSCLIVSVALTALPVFRRRPVHRALAVETAVLLLAAAYGAVALSPYPWDMKLMYGAPPLAALVWVRYRLGRLEKGGPVFSNRSFWLFALSAVLVAGGSFLYWSAPVGAGRSFHGLFLMSAKFVSQAWKADMRFNEGNLTQLALLGLYGAWVWAAGRKALRAALVAAFAAVCVLQRRFLFGPEAFGGFGDLLFVWPFALCLLFVASKRLRDVLVRDFRVFVLFAATAFLYWQIYPGFDELHFRFMLYPAVFLTFWFCAPKPAPEGGAARPWRDTLRLLPLLAYMAVFHGWELAKIAPMIAKDEAKWAYLESEKAKVWLPRPLAETVSALVSTVQKGSSPSEAYYETWLLLSFLMDRPHASGYRTFPDSLTEPAQRFLVGQLEAARPPFILADERYYGPGRLLSSPAMGTLRTYLDVNYSEAMRESAFILLKRNPPRGSSLKSTGHIG